MEPLVHLTVDLLPEILLITASRAKERETEKHAVGRPDFRSFMINDGYLDLC